MNKKVLRTAVVGVGNMGSAHAANIRDGKIDSMVLAALCDTSAAKRAWAKENFSGVEIYENIDKMLEKCELDAIIIAVPHYFHVPCAIKALEKGINVMVEKPISVSVSDAEKLVSASQKADVTLGIMFNQRTSPIFSRYRDIVKSGELGEIKRISWCVTSWHRTDSYYRSSSWRASWGGEGGGVLINQAPHNLDMLNWIFGTPKTVRARCVEGKYHDIEVEDFAHIYAEYENGATLDFLTTTGEYPGVNRLEAVGDRGRLVLEGGTVKHWKLPFSEKEFRHTSEKGSCTEALEYTEYKLDDNVNGHANVLNTFAQSVLNGTPLVADIFDGINELELSNAAYLSAWTDKTVTLPIDRNAFDALLEEKKKNSCYDAEKGKSEETLPDGKISTRWQIKW